MSSETYVAIVLTSVLTGAGSAIGQYFALKYAIQHMDKIPSVKDRIKELAKRGAEK